MQSRSLNIYSCYDLVIFIQLNKDLIRLIYITEKAQCHLIKYLDFVSC